jgi:putative ABC transport system permease protein
MQTLMQDLRYSARMLLKNPGFTSVAVLTLGLGIAVNTTIFSAANSLLFRPLLVGEPARLVVLWATNLTRGLNEEVVSVPDFTDWKERSRSLDSLTAAFGAAHYLTGVDQPVRVSSYHVSASLFPLLGVQPMLGRTFLPEEDRPNVSSVVVLSYGLWDRRFGADPNIIGQAIKLDGESHTVIGIMPRNFTSPSVSVAVADL